MLITLGLTTPELPSIHLGFPQHCQQQCERIGQYGCIVGYAPFDSKSSFRNIIHSASIDVGVPPPTLGFGKSPHATTTKISDNPPTAGAVPTQSSRGEYQQRGTTGNKLHTTPTDDIRQRGSRYARGGSALSQKTKTKDGKSGNHRWKTAGVRKVWKRSSLHSHRRSNLW